MTDKKQHTIYRLADGTRVPSVTTYLGILNKPALVGWAWKLGLQGEDYNVVRDEAARIGTLAHSMVCDYLSNKETAQEEFDYCTLEEIDAAQICFSKFVGWAEQHKLESILLETPLVSEIFKYGGTPDFYGLVDGVPTLLDFKTSAAVYEENFYQLVAYGNLLAEAGHEITDMRVLRIGKNPDEEIEDVLLNVDNLHNYWDVFLACQQIYGLRKVIKQVDREAE